MTWSNSVPKSVYPPVFVYDPNTVSVYEKPERPSLDARLAFEKAKNNNTSVPTPTIPTSSSPNSIRSLIPSRFKKAQPHRNSLQQARQHNNALGACSLPQQAYSRIFLECAQLPLRESEEWSWMNVTYVCSDWRNAALQCRQLWASIDFSTLRRTAISLIRAKGQPLSIRTTAKKSNHQQLKNILSTAHQIDVIHLDSSFDDIQPLLETLAHPNPALTSLVVNVLSTISSAVAYNRPDFPLFGQQLRLRTAELNAAPLFLLSYHCPALTHLTLRNLPQTESQTDIAELLASLPRLQHLTISQCTIQSKSPCRQVLLPNLRYLKVEGSLQQVADFLEFVTLSPSCQLSCSLHQLDNLPNNLWRLCQSIATHSYTSSQEVPLETVTLTGNELQQRFTYSYETNPDFRQSVRIRAFGPTAKRGSAAFDICIGPGDSNIPDDTLITTLSGIWRALFLAGVQTLSLHNVDIITQKTWTQLLRTLPQLRVLDVRGYAPSGLAWALLLDVLSPHSGVPRFLTPRLTDIYLHGVDCSSGGFMLSPGGHVNSHADLDDSKFLDVLAACLEQRHRHKMRLRSLTLTRCGQVLQKSLEGVKQVVSHLVWDIRGTTKDKTLLARYRNIHANVPRNDLRHYHRLEAILS